MASFLVIGGCGFIGSHLVEQLLHAGHSVRVLDNLSRPTQVDFVGDYQLLRGSSADPQLLSDAIAGADGCFYLAANSQLSVGWDQSALAHQANLVGFMNLLEAVRGLQMPVVYASSCAVYGDNADELLTERSQVRPLSAYAADKLGCEQHARVASLVHGVPTVGLRIFNVYGPRQPGESPYSRLIGHYLNQLLEGDQVVIAGDGGQLIDLVYVTDVARFLYAAMTHMGRLPGLFNVCSGQALTHTQLVNQLMRITGIELPIRYQRVKQAQIRVAVGDPRRAHQLLGVRAQRSLDSGLRLLVDQLLERQLSNDE